ncbi:MAG TPA: 2-oxoglutarate dehydrogenase complex dihydrolipoyllysine-residue succinyltransferase [Alphaproteobacteria bacterium]|nr:2-oxoglutarate dehydrogenase complex dihydrolipoyllysine-residue succinyltransferase [Alphaproteobacteria bacterium]
MATDITVPALGESVTEATVARWLKKVGDSVAADEPLVELETDKVTAEVPAPAAGVLAAIAVDTGATVEIGTVLGSIDAAGAAVATAPKAAAKPEQSISLDRQPNETPAPGQGTPAGQATPPDLPAAGAAPHDVLSPAVRKMVDDHGLNPANIPASGRDGRLTKGDVIAHVETMSPGEQPGLRGALPAGAAAGAVAQNAAKAAPAPAAKPAQPSGPRPKAEREERVRMTRLRQRIAERLKEAQNTAAMLTTFNEVDMTNVMAVRNEYKDAFEKKHGVKMGFMSFFVKAAIAALKELPAVNAEIDGQDIVYKNYYDIGVAVGTPQGLVVPVVRDADKMGFAEIEKAIAELGRRARDGKLSIEDMQGGTFTISNGGVYGSLMSTPILNPPQSGILGMHKTQERPMVVNGKIEIRPMMYLALSYDHRIIDGREAVTFLVRLKENIEDPRRLLLDL